MKGCEEITRGRGRSKVAEGQKLPLRADLDLWSGKQITSELRTK